MTKTTLGPGRGWEFADQLPLRLHHWHDHQLRDPLAGPHTVQTAIGKAYTAVSFRTDTTELAAATQAGRPSSGIRALPGVVAVGGGMMIRAKGALLGGIGVSGAPGGDQDDACAKAGIAAISDSLELE